MHPTIQQGDTLIIEPCDPIYLSIGDIILFKQDDRLVAHRIVCIEFNPDPDTKSVINDTELAYRAESPLLKSRLWRDAPKAEIPGKESSMGAPEAQRSTKHEQLRFVLRGDFRSNPDPPILASTILGKVVAIMRQRKIRSPYGYGKQLYARTYRISSQINSFLKL